MLVEISESDFYNEVRRMFEGPVKGCPSVLIVALSMLKGRKGSAMIEELWSQIFPLVVGNFHANSQNVMKVLWAKNP